jgi:hypothetical protein
VSDRKEINIGGFAVLGQWLVANFIARCKPERELLILLYLKLIWDRNVIVHFAIIDHPTF